MRRRAYLLCATFAVLSVSVVPIAWADEPPPITVPTPTVPVPQPDPGPVAKPKPQPRPQPAPVAHPSPAATPARTATPTYSPPPARVVPQARVAPKTQKKRPAATHRKKPRPAKPKPAPQGSGVKGAEKTREAVAPPVNATTTKSDSKWMRTALLVVLAGILGVVAFLFVSASAPEAATTAPRRRRLAGAAFRPRERPREVPVEVIAPKALRSPVPLPPAPPAPTATPDEVEPSAPPAELPPGQLLSDLAPAAAAAAVGEAALQGGRADADEVPVEATEEICAIGIWRGYVKSRFYAGLVGEGTGEGIEYALAESEAIRLHGNGTPERTPEAEAAHKALVDYLLETGWQAEPPGNGDGWYALRFRRAAVPAESHSAGHRPTS